MLELAERHAHQLGDPFDTVHQSHPLCDAAVVLNRLKVGMYIHAVDWLATRQTENRYRVRECLGDSAEGVLRSGSGLHCEHSYGIAVLDAAVPVGHVHTGALLSGEDRSDTFPRAHVD